MWKLKSIARLITYYASESSGTGALSGPLSDLIGLSLKTNESSTGI